MDIRSLMGKVPDPAIAHGRQMLDQVISMVPDSPNTMAFKQTILANNKQNQMYEWFWAMATLLVLTQGGIDQLKILVKGFISKKNIEAGMVPPHEIAMAQSVASQGESILAQLQGVYQKILATALAKAQTQVAYAGMSGAYPYRATQTQNVWTGVPGAQPQPQQPTPWSRPVSQPNPYTGAPQNTGSPWDNTPASAPVTPLSDDEKPKPLAEELGLAEPGNSEPDVIDTPLTEQLGGEDISSYDSFPDLTIDDKEDSEVSTETRPVQKPVIDSPVLNVDQKEVSQLLYKDEKKAIHKDVIISSSLVDTLNEAQYVRYRELGKRGHMSYRKAYIIPAITMDTIGCIKPDVSKSFMNDLIKVLEDTECHNVHINLWKLHDIIDTDSKADTSLIETSQKLTWFTMLNRQVLPMANTVLSAIKSPIILDHVVKDAYDLYEEISDSHYELACVDYHIARHIRDIIQDTIQFKEKERETFEDLTSGDDVDPLYLVHRSMIITTPLTGQGMMEPDHEWVKVEDEELIKLYRQAIEKGNDVHEVTYDVYLTTIESLVFQLKEIDGDIIAFRR